MKRILIPLFLGVLGLVAGGASALALRPAPVAEPASDAGSDHAAAKPTPDAAGGHGSEQSSGHGSEGADKDTEAPEYARLSNQFVVPVLEQGRVTAMVILS